MHETKGLCTVVIGSATNATRAESILARAAIRARVIKVSSEQKNGCAYGIEFPCSQKRNVEEILKNARIPIHFPRGE